MFKEVRKLLNADSYYNKLKINESEDWEKGVGDLKPFITVKVTFDDGNTIITPIRLSLEDAKKYYLGNDLKGKLWNVGKGENDYYAKTVSVEEVKDTNEAVEVAEPDTETETKPDVETPVRRNPLAPKPGVSPKPKALLTDAQLFLKAIPESKKVNENEGEQSGKYEILDQSRKSEANFLVYSTGTKKAVLIKIGNKSTFSSDDYGDLYNKFAAIWGVDDVYGQGLYPDQCIEGIYYVENYSMNGVTIDLYIFPEDKAKVNDVVKKLRRERDVVALNKYNLTYGEVQ